MRILSVGLASVLLLSAAASLSAETVRLGTGGFSFRFGRDDRRGDVEGKRASCEVYARIAQVQADASDRFRCGFPGPKWSNDLERHFRWCRWASRSPKNSGHAQTSFRTASTGLAISMTAANAGFGKPGSIATRRPQPLQWSKMSRPLHLKSEIFNSQAV
jgi:hypothetical protein